MAGEFSLHLPNSDMSYSDYADKMKPDVRQWVNRASSDWKSDWKDGLGVFSQVDLARLRASNYRRRSIENIDKLLIEFESNISRQGARVLWAPAAADALKEVSYIINKYNQKAIVKSHSNLFEELGLMPYLSSQHVQVFESDLGNFIKQLAGEKTFHPVKSSLPYSKEYIGRLFHQKLATPYRASANLLADAFLDYTDEQASELKIGICGANFLVADTGSVALTENEGNIGRIISSSEILIVLAGIDKVTSSVNDLDLLWPLTDIYAQGKVATYHTLLSSTAGTSEEGPREIYIILVDNGRSEAVSSAVRREILHCVGCGACSFVCPVYQIHGGHYYENSFEGPGGQLRYPVINAGSDKGKVNACTMCSACRDVCPVNIDIPKMMVQVRNYSNEVNATIQDKYIWQSWKKMMLKRKRLNQNNTLKSFMLKTMFRKNWGEEREFPDLAERPFNQIWFDLYGTGEDEDKII